MIATVARLIGVPSIAIEAALAAALVLAGFFGYSKIYHDGYAAAESQCQAAAIQAELDAVKKDRADARAAAADAALKLAAIQAQTDAEKGRTDDYIAELEKRPVPSCALTCDDLRGLRIASKSCPAGPGPSRPPAIHGAGFGPFGKSK